MQAILVPIHCEGFRSKVTQTEFDAFWHGILKYLVNKQGIKQKNLVNLIAPFRVSWGDRRELTRLLGRLDLKVNYVPEFSSVSDLKKMSEAILTISTCPSFGDYLQQGLKQHFDIPYFRNPIPIGSGQTADWLRKIAEITKSQVNVEEIIKEELESIKLPVENIKKQLDKKKASFYINAGQSRALGLPLLANELGLEISGVSTLEHDLLSVDDLKKIQKKCGDYKIHVAEYQAFEQSAIVDKLKPDIYSGCPMVGAVYTCFISAYW